MSLVSISEKLKISVQVAKYHLRKLVKEKVILGFKPHLDIGKLGFQWHLVLVQLKDLSSIKKKRLLDFLENDKRIYYVSNTIGQYNLMIDVHVRTIEEFRKIIFEIKEKFSDIIKLVELFNVFEEYKIDYFPKNLV